MCMSVFCLPSPVLFEEPSLKAPNQQVYDLSKLLKRHCGK